MKRRCGARRGGEGARRVECGLLRVPGGARLGLPRVWYDVALPST